MRGSTRSADLARAFGIDADALRGRASPAWNAACAAAATARSGGPRRQHDADRRRRPSSPRRIWPIVSNTQGGPAHDERQRVLDAFGAPIPGLFDAGELGSVFGHLYMSGGNIAECFVGGRIAGEEAAGAREALARDDAA